MSPIQSSQSHKDSAVTLWLTMAAAAVRTHRQSRVESSHTSLAESKVLMPHVSFSWSDSGDRAWRKKRM